MRLLLAAMLITGCANVASEPEVDAGDIEDSAAEVSADTEPSPFDARFPDLLADAARLDAASCASRTEACGTLSSDPLQRVLRSCLSVEWTCGIVTVAIDGEGCVTAIVFGKPSPKFEACVVAELSTKRFACLMAGTRSLQFESCTTK